MMLTQIVRDWVQWKFCLNLMKFFTDLSKNINIYADRIFKCSLVQKKCKNQTPFKCGHSFENYKMHPVYITSFDYHILCHEKYL